MTPKVPMSEIGTEMAGMKVARQFRRKTKTTMMTRPMEMIMLRSASATEARIVLVRSLSICNVMVGGRAAWN